MPFQSGFVIFAFVGVIWGLLVQIGKAALLTEGGAQCCNPCVGALSASNENFP